MRLNVVSFDVLSYIFTVAGVMQRSKYQTVIFLTGNR